MLGGRAWEASFFPLTWAEMPGFDLLKYFNRGGLPKVYLSKYPEEDLKAYTRLYINEEVKAEALTDLMWALNELRVERYVDFNPVSLKPYELDPPQTALTVTLSDTNVIGRIVLLGGKTENGRFAMIQGQNIVFVVSEETAQTLTRELTVPIEKQAEEIKQP